MDGGRGTKWAAGAWDAIAVGYAARAAAFTGSFAPDLLAAVRVGPGASVLDVAAGSGAAALAARCVPGVGRVHACDISPSMLEQLEAAAAAEGGAAAVETTVCDAEALSMASGSFDCVVSNFGVVFAGSLPTALAEMARVARPGGRLAFTTWGRTPAFTVIEDAWRATYPASAPPAPAPRADGAAVTAQLEQLLRKVGGLTDLSVVVVERELVVARPEDYWERMLVSSPSRAGRMAAALSEAEREGLRAAALENLLARFGDGPVRLPAEAYVAAATKAAGEPAPEELVGAPGPWVPVVDCDAGDAALFADAEGDASQDEAGAPPLAVQPVLMSVESTILSVKPLEGETDLGELEAMVRALDGAALGCAALCWEGCRREDMAFGLQKLVLLCAYEGGKGVAEALAQAIEGFESSVGSVDVEYSGHPSRARGIFGQRDDDGVENVE
jgi:ubiquinone/menaquinone biosynthesis C-methylase UbiE/translation elongation factor EF-1beta